MTGLTSKTSTELSRCLISTVVIVIDGLAALVLVVLSLVVLLLPFALLVICCCCLLPSLFLSPAQSEIKATRNVPEYSEYMLKVLEVKIGILRICLRRKPYRRNNERRKSQLGRRACIEVNNGNVISLLPPQKPCMQQGQRFWIRLFGLKSSITDIPSSI
jgi:hypothetical protein